MKEIVKKAQSFMTFESQLEIGYISGLFATTHHQQQNKVPHWAVGSTRVRLISHYWFTQVLGHFGLLLILALLIVLFTSNTVELGHFPAILIAAVLSFGVLLFSQYLPRFMHDFLPKLETVTSTYQRELAQQEIAQLQLNIGQQKKEIERLKLAVSKSVEEAKKCREAQLSNLAVVLIYYIFAQKAGLPDLKADNQTSQLLMQLYGISPVSIRQNLELITGAGGKGKKLSGRKATETRSRFEEAFQFFENQNYAEGTQILKALEMKVFKP
ncbi:hypothetical protein P2H89_15445 [Paraflavitalea sp. CAU 1676]|nr:hypothetical protein [Paraflavitalea sp. CAU 1676]